jgi:hypothetical protein
MAFLQFDASKVAPQERPAPIPAGVYNARIIESEVKPLASGNGEGMRLTWEVLDGPCASRKVFQRINYRHTNPEAERIGQSQLSAICHAVGVMQLQDTQQLHGRPCRIRVKIRKDTTGQYDDQNEVSAVEAAGGPQPSMPTMPAQPAPAAAPANAPAAGAVPPWQRRTA